MQRKPRREKEMSEKVLGFEAKYADEKKEKRKKGFDNRIVRYHTFTILAEKLVPVVSLQALKEYCDEHAVTSGFGIMPFIFEKDLFSWIEDQGIEKK